MSLLMDALKKAQQLRSKEPKGGPFFKSQGKNKKRDDRQSWKAIGGAAAGLCILLLVVWKFVLEPVPPPKIAISLKGGLSPTATRTIPPEVRKEPGKTSTGEEPKRSSNPGLKENERIAQNIKEETTPLKPDPGEKEDPNPAPILGLQGNGRTAEKKKEEKTSGNPDPVEKIVRSSHQEKKPAVVEKPASPPMFEKEETAPLPHQAKQESVKDLLEREVIRRFNAGVSFHTKREWGKAIQAYQKVIEMDPAYVEAYNNLGVLYQEMGDLDGALKSYQKAIEINPIYEKGLNNIGILLSLKGENDRAMEMFLKVLAVNPNHIESHIHLGTLYKKNGQLDKGVESYLRALNMNPFQAEAHYNLGLLYEQMGKKDLAVSHLRQFIYLSSDAYPDLVARVRRHIDQLTKTKGVKKE